MAFTNPTYEKEYYKQYRLRNREKIRLAAIAYRAANKERIASKKKLDRLSDLSLAKARCHETYLRNKQKRKEYSAAWYRKNKEASAKYSKIYKQKTKQKRNAREKERRDTDARVAMLNRLRNRLRKLISQTPNARKADTTLRLVGCDFQQFMRHIESQFKPGMHWNNRVLWHIDHKHPCALFDLTDPAQQRACFHYTNLQPLWAYENLSKGAKIIH